MHESCNKNFHFHETKEDNSFNKKLFYPNDLNF